jgi:PhoPQ-activated pathogenicity-related protein
MAASILPRRPPVPRLAVLLAVASAGFAQAQSPTALTDYVARPEPDYKWELKDTTATDAGTVYTIELVSQKWQGVLWKHPLQVVVPKGAAVGKTMVIYNQGGDKPDPRYAAFGLEIARRMNAPVAILSGIPSQPIESVGGKKKEDALIAETFVRYLETGDPSWPLLFPMAKSLVKTMDALQAFAKDTLKTELTGFVVSGASKRGWTSWLTAATGDKRVKAIAPLVIDTLNFLDQMPNQLKSFDGKYSLMIHDYEERKLLPLPDSDRGRQLWAMVDPWVYREKLTLPKMIVNGTNDPYWAQDALNLYWDGLPGDKYICYVPNAGHDLRPMEQPKLQGAKKDLFPMKAVNTLAAFSKTVIDGKEMPKLRWGKTGDATGLVTLVVESEPAPVAAKLWVAESNTRDFRESKWNPAPADGKAGKYAANVTPGEKYKAALVECEYAVGELKYTLTTQIAILEPKK